MLRQDVPVTGPRTMDDPASIQSHRDELLEQLARAHRRLAERDAEIRRLLERDAEIAHLRTELERVSSEHQHLSLRLEAMRHTRAWRAVTLYWRLRGRLLGE
jgi:ubiquinone biosynthesis protein UbiJ